MGTTKSIPVHVGDEWSRVVYGGDQYFEAVNPNNDPNKIYSITFKPPIFRTCKSVHIVHTSDCVVTNHEYRISSDTNDQLLATSTINPSSGYDSTCVIDFVGQGNFRVNARVSIDTVLDKQSVIKLGVWIGLISIFLALSIFLTYSELNSFVPKIVFPAFIFALLSVYVPVLSNSAGSIVKSISKTLFNNRAFTYCFGALAVVALFLNTVFIIHFLDHRIYQWKVKQVVNTDNSEVENAQEKHSKIIKLFNRYPYRPHTWTLISSETKELFDRSPQKAAVFLESLFGTGPSTAAKLNVGADIVIKNLLENCSYSNRGIERIPNYISLRQKYVFGEQECVSWIIDAIKPALYGHFDTPFFEDWKEQVALQYDCVGTVMAELELQVADPSVNSAQGRREIMIEAIMKADLCEDSHRSSDYIHIINFGINELTLWCSETTNADDREVYLDAMYQYMHYLVGQVEQGSLRYAGPTKVMILNWIFGLLSPTANGIREKYAQFDKCFGGQDGLKRGVNNSGFAKYETLSNGEFWDAGTLSVVPKLFNDERNANFTKAVRYKTQLFFSMNYGAKF